MFAVLLAILAALVSLAALSGLVVSFIPYIVRAYEWATQVFWSVFGIYPSWVVPLFAAGLVIAAVSIIIKVV